MTTQNHQARFGNKNKLGKVKADKLVAYNIRIDPATVVLIKQIQALRGLKSQGEVITLAIKSLIELEK